MLVAKEKRKENIAEYIIYMWQLEDMIRGCEFDVSKIVSQFNYPKTTLNKVTQWYSQLSEAMQNEGLQKSGHLMQLKELVQDLSELNIKLLKSKKFKKYEELFNDAIPHISEIVDKSKGALRNEIDACLTGVYGLFMLRLQGIDISEETANALQSFTKLLACLSHKYHQLEKGEIDV